MCVPRLEAWLEEVKPILLCSFEAYARKATYPQQPIQAAINNIEWDGRKLLPGLLRWYNGSNRGEPLASRLAYEMASLEKNWKTAFGTKPGSILSDFKKINQKLLADLKEESSYVRFFHSSFPITYLPR